ncbi:hypothetical protein ACFSL4_24835, partial [Streptomyces caeni]
GAGTGAFGQGAPGAPQGLQSAQAFQGPGSRQGGFGDGGSGMRPVGFGDDAPAAAPQQGTQQQAPQQQPKGRIGRRRPQLPGRGGPRAELPGAGPQQQRTPSWSDENAQPPVPRASLDAPRGHEEPDALSATSPMPRVDDRQGPGSTAEIPRVDDRQGPGSTGGFHRPDFNAPRPGAAAPNNGGPFVRSDVFGGAGGGTGQFPPGRGQDTGGFPAPGRAQDPSSTGQFASQGYDNSSTGQFAAPGYDNSSTGQFAAPGYDASSTGQFAAPGYDNSSTGQFASQGYGGGQDPASTGQFERPQPAGDGYGGYRPPAQQQPPRRQESEALPPAGPGDGRTPLYDTLETNWFRGDRRQNNGSAAPSAQQQPSGAPQRPASPPSPAWRSSPNDELVRQAERVRQPAAGGVTTSGLPRRVPRANLVPGTAQQQQHHSGPQVSRAPDDVRGRLTNLRRGIAQGRQAGGPQTGSFPSPSHQQER